MQTISRGSPSRRQLARAVLVVTVAVSLVATGPTARAASADPLPGPIPRSGVAVPALAPVDDAMARTMEQGGATAGTLTVYRGGQVLLERGYGWIDQARTVPLPPHTPMRQASITKLVIAAAIDRLLFQRRLRYSDQVFCTPGTPLGRRCILRYEPIGGQLPDPRLGDITVQHLLDHTGGWNSAVSPYGDIAFQALAAAAETGAAPPGTIGDWARYVISKPLDFAPGTQAHYANAGYTFLGLVVEQVSGKPLTSFLLDDVLGPLGAGDMHLARSLPQDRSPREPWYDSGQERGQNVFDPSRIVPAADGAYHFEGGLVGAGALVSTGRSLARLIGSRHGTPRDVAPVLEAVWYGSIAGTNAAVHLFSNGALVIATVNNRYGPDAGTLTAALQAAVSQVASWPTTEVDVVPPTITPGAVALEEGGRLTTGVPVRASWTGTDASSGVRSSTVRARVLGFDLTGPTVGPNAGAATVTAARGLPTTVVVSATDWAGNTASATVGRVTTDVLEETATSLRYSGGWLDVYQPGASGGSVRTTRTPGAWMQATVTGRAVALVAAVGPTRGIARVTIDGRATDVDLYAETEQAARIVIAPPDLGSGAHTVRVEATGRRGTALATDTVVDVDAVVVLR